MYKQHANNISINLSLQTLGTDDFVFSFNNRSLWTRIVSII